MTELLSFDDVSKSYGDEQVLDGVSFAMEQSDVEVIIGPSGSGKSTMLRCVNRLTDIDDGAIYLDGHSIHDIGVNDLRRRVGMVFQDFNLFAHRTARGNITLGLRKVRGFSKEDAVAAADEHLERVGLADQAASYPAELSGGQKQRVGIARALAMDPELLLFDEPTSALDPELIGDVLSVMGDLADEGMTMLCVTHEMSFARSVADTITFLDDGRIAERGPPEQLFEAPETDRARDFLGEIDG
ncbi:ABC-type transport system ATP-binding protein (probable substrate glutamine/glutamate/polar amino acids) [Natronomonas pharaonis DSM 2160]|uniref:ABC-type transport system ATP-binding protein (Probable substrate glutamine/glutamate/polar amino acids) n=1 Tax=Natronomonas pharaonis (strain ATCC 35678 / DSM 2160 / CIP 103997 / JCM 8858 / NBRC 14720 / NCIMB 2260 / Gabara) TaxID=348780 RepID=A0A1U7EVE0_NATPD|nr:amino acid ABC transporter ATP-binding protein [Natronomonas pharaonis]CAI48980.1 ABC-type transport system ATP-binding protein (probable substrate glutamine/glutamate/polar amino acids) [Natronomonas pharaonis DSM 2160]